MKNFSIFLSVYKQDSNSSITVRHAGRTEPLFSAAELHKHKADKCPMRKQHYISKYLMQGMTRVANSSSHSRATVK
jgi:hypothetical protein